MITAIKNTFGKPKTDPKIAVGKALVVVRESRDGVKNLLPRYMDWSVEAAQNGDDEYSNQLLEEMAELSDFVGDLTAIEQQIVKGAVSAMALNDLNKLTGVIKTSKALFSAGPNFTKIGRSLAEFSGNLRLGASSVKDLRRELSAGKVPDDLGLFNTSKPVENAKVAALREERERRLMKPTITVAEPKDAPANEHIDIDAIIEDENKKE
jgi:hypothetical protein